MSKSLDDILGGDFAEPKTLDATIKSVAGNVAKNLTTIGSLVVVFAFILIFLFDIELNTKLTVRLAADAVVSAVLFQFFRAFQGEDGRKSGKADKDYLDSKQRYAGKLNDLHRIGTSKIQAFCDEYVAENLRVRRVKILHQARVDFSAYEANYINADKRTIMRTKELTRKQRLAVVAANNLRPAVLTPDMIVLGDFGSEMSASIMTPPSVKDKRQVQGGLFATILMATFSSVIAFGGSATPTAAKAVYCLLKLCFMLFQGIKERYQKHILYSVDAVKYNDWLSAMIGRYEDFFAKAKEAMTHDADQIHCDDVEGHRGHIERGEPIGDAAADHEGSVQRGSVRVCDSGSDEARPACAVPAEKVDRREVLARPPFAWEGISRY